MEMQIPALLRADMQSQTKPEHVHWKGAQMYCIEQKGQLFAFDFSFSFLKWRIC